MRFLLALLAALWATAAAADNLVGCRLLKNDQPGSMGVVVDRTYYFCNWPRPLEPTAIFAEGSSGIKVVGGTTPRNIVFPPDTELLPYYPDAKYPAEVAWQKVYGGDRRVQDLEGKEADDWVAGFEAASQAVIAENPRATVFQTDNPDRFYFKDDRDAETVTPLSKKEADDLARGKVDRNALRRAKGLPDKPARDHQ